MKYSPPLTITSKILNLVAQISEQLGRFSERQNKIQSLRLRRINQIKSIQGSLAIEGNSLSVDQITAVLEGKPVIAPPREVQEVKNALQVYESFSQLNPYQEEDLLNVHRQLLAGLIPEVGHYRSGGVGVMSGSEVIHMAPPASQVPRLMHDLFQWLEETDLHPLIASAVFHYEFEFIHPFADGNGRMGRLWQSLILAKWNPVFANLPVESLVFNHQEGYYQAISDSTDKTDCFIFVEFILEMIAQVLASEVEDQLDGGLVDRLADRLVDELTENQKQIIQKILENPRVTILQMATELGISKTAVDKNLKKLKSMELIKRIGTPKSGYWVYLK